MINLTSMPNQIQARQPDTWESNKSQVKDSRLRKACAEFEAIFVYYMLSSARKALPEDGLFNSTHESKIFKSMMDDQMARAATKGRGLGLGALLYNELREGETKGSVDVSDYM
jgi:flagellar protein FlgJ